MKDFKWSILNYVSVSDVVIFMLWLDCQPSGEVTRDHVHKETPVQNNKLSRLMNVLTYLEFASIDEKQIKIHSLGREFIRSEPNQRVAILRNRLLSEDLFQETLSLLNQSSTGRLRIKAVVDVFQRAYGSYVALHEVVGFIEWAAACRIFGRDKWRNEIVRLGGGTPGKSVATGLAS
jgi:hypothetical protein